MLLSIRYILAIYIAYFNTKRRYICPLSHKTTACTLYLVNIDLALKFNKILTYSLLFSFTRLLKSKKGSYNPFHVLFLSDNKLSVLLSEQSTSSGGHIIINYVCIIYEWRNIKMAH